MEHFTLGSRYYFSRLSDFEKKVYRDIYDGWVNGDSSIKIMLPGTGFELPTGTELHQIVTYVIEDNPHLFHLETTQFNYHRHGKYITIKAENVYSKEEYEAIYRELLVRVGQIVEKANRYTTDYEKLRFLHDYLAENITYDLGAADPKSQREVHTIVGALLNSACVCDGYSRAYRLLCDQIHISCIVAIGKSTQSENGGPHAWNFVKINNKVYHADITWDSGLIAKGFPIPDYYFLRNDVCFSKDHAWDHSLYHPVKEDYPRTERFISNKSELEQFICEKLKAGEPNIIVQLADSFPNADSLEKLLEAIASRNPAVFRRVKKYGYAYYDGTKCAKLSFSFNKQLIRK